MLPSRLSKHFKEQNWLLVFVDLLIVVIGVFLGLQAQEWAEVRAEANRATLIEQQLLSEFRVISDELEDAVEATAHFAQAAQETYSSLENTAEVIDLDHLKEILLAAGTSHPPVGRSPLFAQLVATGELSLIDDPTLLNALYAYESWALNSDDIFKIMVPRILDIADQVDQFVVSAPAGNGLGPLKISSIDLDAMRENRHIYHSLNRINRNLYGRYLGQKQSAERVIEILNAPE